MNEKATAIANVTETAENVSPIVAMVERLARDPDIPIEKMERMLDMQERILAAQARAEYDEAFAAMQSELPEIGERGQIVVHGKLQSKYALFEDVNEAVKPVLSKHGFGLSFRTERADGMMIVTGILSHRGGHREKDSIPLPLDTSGSKNSVQAVGSSLSYGKRYLTLNMLNISTRGEDDDGRAGGAGQTISEEQFFALRNLIEKAGADEDAFCKYLKVDLLETLPANRFDAAVSALNAKIKKGGAQ